LLAGWLQAIEWGGKISIFQELAICTCLLILGIKKIDFQRLVLTLSEACATNFEKFIFLMPYFQHQVAEMAIASRLLGLASALISKRSRDYLLSIRNRHQFRNIRWIHRACVVSCALLIASYPLGNFIGQGKVWLLSIPLIVVQIISANAIGILLDWKFFAGVEASARMRQRKLRFFVFLLLGQVILAAVTISMMSRYETNFLFYVPSTILIFALPLISKL
jgi:hypothetical protein